MGKSTISMAIFNCYVSSPEGNNYDSYSSSEPDIWGLPRTLKQRINDLLAGSLAGMILQGAIFQGDFHHFSGPVFDGFRSKAAALVYGAPLPAFKGREAQGSHSEKGAPDQTRSRRSPQLRWS